MSPKDYFELTEIQKFVLLEQLHLEQKQIERETKNAQRQRRGRR
jgi:hypothetical protein